MNHCHDCNSSYSTPGTCNCFAPGGKRYVGTQGGTFVPAQTPVLVPIYVPPTPLTPHPFPWGTTIWCGDIDRTSIAAGGRCTITHLTVGNNASCCVAGCRGDCGICKQTSQSTVMS